MAVIKKARKFGMTLGKNKARRHIYFLRFGGIIGLFSLSQLKTILSV
jgi:hypothetical protein